MPDWPLQLSAVDVPAGACSHPAEDPLVECAEGPPFATALQRLLLDVFLVPGPLQGFGAPSLFLFAHIILERKTTSKPHTHDCEHKHTNEQNTGKSLSKKRKSQAGW